MIKCTREQENYVRECIILFITWMVIWGVVFLAIMDITLIIVIITTIFAFGVLLWLVGEFNFCRK